jgi:hypothetical protein
MKGDEGKVSLGGGEEGEGRGAILLLHQVHRLPRADEEVENNEGGWKSRKKPLEINNRPFCST